MDNTSQTQVQSDATGVRKSGGWLMVAGEHQILLCAFTLEYTVATTSASICNLGTMVIVGGIFLLIGDFKAQDWEPRGYDSNGCQRFEIANPGHPVLLSGGR